MKNEELEITPNDNGTWNYAFTETPEIPDEILMSEADMQIQFAEEVALADAEVAEEVVEVAAVEDIPQSFVVAEDAIMEAKKQTKLLESIAILGSIIVMMVGAGWLLFILKAVL